MLCVSKLFDDECTQLLCFLFLYREMPEIMFWREVALPVVETLDIKAGGYAQSLQRVNRDVVWMSGPESTCDCDFCWCLIACRSLSFHGDGVLSYGVQSPKKNGQAIASSAGNCEVCACATNSRSITAP